MTDSSEDEKNLELVKSYFRLGDARAPEFIKLFHTDLQYYFPKFGIGHGPQSVFEMFSGFAEDLEEIKHDVNKFLFIARAPYVVVEGVTRGRMHGKTWEAGKTPGGRFCNVFEIRDGLIFRCHVYLDPDYVSEDEPRFRWGREGREW